MNMFKPFKSFNRFAEPALSAAEGSNPLPLVLPRDAGEDEGGGLNGLNFLNDLNHAS